MTMINPSGPLRRVSAWTIRRLPTILITDTFQVMFAVAFVGMGASTIAAIAQPSVVASILPNWLRIMWAAQFIVGGLVQLLAMSYSRRLAERCGMALCAIGCLVYAGALINTGRVSSVIIGGLFVIIALAYVVRIMASTAARVRIEEERA